MTVLASESDDAARPSVRSALSSGDPLRKASRTALLWCLFLTAMA